MNQDITVEELKELMDSGKAFNFIDVRNEDEYEEDNLGATLIPLGELASRVQELESIKDEDIYIHCRSGARSGQAKNYLTSSLGFSKVHNVIGGIMAFREMEG
ncbi:Rhodanese-related sulfurtransferase [Spirosomataceae bacterium TFI 002]|nr:Rhodanese-related sulfurtransferase [Spirosomataceae bacterium TFI 002]